MLSLRHQLLNRCCLLLLLGAAALLSFSSCESGNSTAVAKATAKSIGSIPTKVTTAKAVKKTFERRLQAKGKVVSLQRADLFFQEAGIIKEVRAKNGQWVNKGQLIASQNTDFLNISLQKAQQQVQVSEQKFLAQACDYGYCLEDTAKLPPTQKSRLLAQSGLAQARISVAEEKLRIERSKIKAPFSGRIANLTQQAHQQADISKPFCTIYQPQALAVEASIMESEYVELLGTKIKARVRTVGNTQKVYDSYLESTNPIVQENGLVQVRFKLKRAKDILVGMNVSLEIVIPQKEQVIVPKEAVILRSGRPVVFSLTKNNTAYWHYVNIGESNDQEQAILEGIEEGMDVITSNHLQLAHDTEVVVDSQPSP